ncbi:MAG: hypothetical protein K6G90_00300 [Clostridia bacterium]|nr:hypothetical protein [Clostridia bacterium]
MNDSMLLHHAYVPGSVIGPARDLGADQLTFRALWAPDTDTPQGEWISRHVTGVTFDFIDSLKADMKAAGRYLDTLEYGADRYDYHGFSVVIDED